MPNHIANKLTITTNNEQELREVLNFLCGDSTEEYIDFNSIIPMPQCLKDTEASSIVTNAVICFLYHNERFDLIDKLFPYRKNIDTIISKKSAENLQDTLELGCKYFKIYEECGFFSWYEWSCANWGTKWNAYDTILEEYDNNAIIYFNTAWSGVPHLIEILCTQFPNISFEYKFADEDMGYNCGEGNSNGEGEFYFDYYSGDDDAMELYIECWGYNREDFYKDENGDWHNRLWEDNE